MKDTRVSLSVCGCVRGLTLQGPSMWMLFHTHLLWSFTNWQYSLNLHASLCVTWEQWNKRFNKIWTYYHLIHNSIVNMLTNLVPHQILQSDISFHLESHFWPTDKCKFKTTLLLWTKGGWIDTQATHSVLITFKKYQSFYIPVLNLGGCITSKHFQHDNCAKIAHI